MPYIKMDEQAYRAIRSILADYDRASASYVAAGSDDGLAEDALDCMEEACAALMDAMVPLVGKSSFEGEVVAVVDAEDIADYLGLEGDGDPLVAATLATVADGGLHEYCQDDLEHRIGEACRYLAARVASEHPELQAGSGDISWLKHYGMVPAYGSPEDPIDTDDDLEDDLGDDAPSEDPQAL